MINEYLQQLQEGYLFSDKTISIDLDKFESGESKKLLIMGLSGGGKSTLGTYLAKKYNCNFNELDICCRNSMTEQEHKDYVNKFFSVSPEMYKKFYNRCFKPALLSNEKEIIEGILYQTYAQFPETRQLMNKFPVIIIGKSAIKASYDRTQRAMRNPKNKDATILDIIKKINKGLYLNIKYLQKFLDIFKEERLKVGGDVKEFIIPELEGVIKR